MPAPARLEAEQVNSLDGENSGEIPRSRHIKALLAAGGLTASGMLLAGAADTGAPIAAYAGGVSPGIIAVACLLLTFSAFFSASEVAFYSLHRLQLRAMQGSSLWADRLAARLMARDRKSVV